MKRIAVLPLIILVVISSIAYAEQKTNKKTAATATEKKRAKQTHKYTTIQIDPNLEKLPLNYYGNDPNLIWWTIEKRQKAAVKGEFETSEDFEKKIIKLKRIPVIGKISSESLFAFQVGKSEIKYFADTSEIKVNIEFRNISETSWCGSNKVIKPDYNNAKEMTLTSKKTISAYTAQNSYGATTEVSRYSYDDYAAVFNNYNEFPFGKSIIIKASPDEAKKIKDQVRVLLIANIDEDLICQGSRTHQATMDSPSEFKFLSHYIYVNLKEIWIYNQVSGQIYSKIKKT